MLQPIREFPGSETVCIQPIWPNLIVQRQSNTIAMRQIVTRWADRVRAALDGSSATPTSRRKLDDQTAAASEPGWGRPATSRSTIPRSSSWPNAAWVPTSTAEGFIELDGSGTEKSADYGVTENTVRAFHRKLYREGDGAVTVALAGRAELEELAFYLRAAVSSTTSSSAGRKLFAADGVYKVVARENYDRGLPLCTILAEGHPMMRDRIARHDPPDDDLCPGRLPPLGGEPARFWEPTRRGRGSPRTLPSTSRARWGIPACSRVGRYLDLVERDERGGLRYKEKTRGLRRERRPWVVDLSSLRALRGVAPVAKNGFKVFDSDMRTSWSRPIGGSATCRKGVPRPGADRRDVGKRSATCACRCRGSRIPPLPASTAGTSERNQKLYADHAARSWSPECQLEAMDTAKASTSPVMFPSRAPHPANDSRHGCGVR